MDAQKSDPPTTAAAPLKANSVQSVSPQSQSASISVSNTNTNAVNAGPSTSRGTGSNSSGAGASRKKRKRILDGVVVAFSGYKNPFRSELRDLCLKLGAKYRQDWTDDCTHLMHVVSVFKCLRACSLLCINSFFELASLTFNCTTFLR